MLKIVCKKSDVIFSFYFQNHNLSYNYVLVEACAHTTIVILPIPLYYYFFFLVFAFFCYLDFIICLLFSKLGFFMVTSRSPNFLTLPQTPYFFHVFCNCQIRRFLSKKLDSCFSGINKGIKVIKVEGTCKKRKRSYISADISAERRPKSKKFRKQAG